MMSRTLQSRWNAPDTSFLDAELEAYLSEPNPLRTLAPMRSQKPPQRSSEELAQLGPDPMSRPRPQMRAGSLADMDDREVLARTIAAEAGGESAQGQLAVAAVIANRARKQNKSMRDVSLARGQFSAWNSLTGYAGGEGGLDMFNLKVSDDIYGLTDQVMAGNYQDPTGGAANYYNPAVANPKWGANYGGNFPTKIGNHIFGWAK